VVTTAIRYAAAKATTSVQPVSSTEPP
jgi:hypothetical protein